jgi:hypothetical protein
MPRTFSLVLNSSNVVAGSNNSQYQYQFIGGNFTCKNGKISLSSATIPYSWFNISPQWNNQLIRFSYTVAGSITTLSDWTIPTGFYSTSDLNNYLILQLQNLNYYLINTAGQYVFYVSLTTNQQLYANQLVLTTVPAASNFTYNAGTGIWTGNAGTAWASWTTPVGFPGFPTVATTPGIFFPTSGSVASVLGFTTGVTYGNSTTDVSQISQSTPVATPVNSLILLCNLVNNRVTVPSNILDSIPIESTTFGANLVFSPSFQRWVSVQDGTYNTLSISICDDNLIPIQAQDPHLLLTLVLDCD